MMDRFAFLPAEERRVLLAGALGALAALWLAVAWAEPMVLLALPLLALLCFGLIRTLRRRAAARDEDFIY